MANVGSAAPSNLVDRLTSKEILIGSFVKTPAPINIEIMAGTSLDLLCLDAEHAPFDRAHIDGCIAAARSAETDILVRVPSLSPEHILNALDCGANGILCPHVKSAQAASDLVRFCRYGPRGRGFSASTRAARYGGTTISEHLERAGSTTAIIAQIEDPEAVPAVDEIAAIDGLTACFVGYIDLMIALGKTDPQDPLVIDAITQIVDACRSADTPVGMFVPRNRDVVFWKEKGVSFFLQGSDQSFLRSGADTLRQEIGLSSDTILDGQPDSTE